MTRTDPLSLATLWLWLLRDGGAWTAADLAQQLGADATTLSRRLSGYANRGQLTKFGGIDGSSGRVRYAVTGTCLVPLGLHLAELQDDAISAHTSASVYAAATTFCLTTERTQR